MLVIIVICVVFYAVLCALFSVFQHKLLFKQTRFPSNHRFHYEFPFEELNWKTMDGNKINGLWFKQQNPRGVILFFHGNSGHMGRSGNYFGHVKEHGYDVVMYDYRGYGKSTGFISRRNLYSDGLMVAEWVKAQYPGVPIVYHGLSLGSHVAAYVATKVSPALLILETPFCDLTKLAQRKYFFMPVRLLSRFNLCTSCFLSRISAPIHVFHGTNDKVVPLSEAQLVAELSGAEITVVVGGTHKNLREFMAYSKTLKQLLDKVVNKHASI